jgi:hypothetical protein
MATDLLVTGLVPVRFKKLSVKKKAFMLYGEGVAAGRKKSLTPDSILNHAYLEH